MANRSAERYFPGDEQDDPIRLLHHVGHRTIPFEAEQESSGTLAYLALVGRMVGLLKNSGATS
jgi:hypothetical protein